MFDKIKYTCDGLGNIMYFSRMKLVFKKIVAI